MKRKLMTPFMGLQRLQYDVYEFYQSLTGRQETNRRLSNQTRQEFVWIHSLTYQYIYIYIAVIEKI